MKDPEARRRGEEKREGTTRLPQELIEREREKCYASKVSIVCYLLEVLIASTITGIVVVLPE